MVDFFNFGKLVATTTGQPGCNNLLTTFSTWTLQNSSKRAAGVLFPFLCSLFPWCFLSWNGVFCTFLFPQVFSVPASGVEMLPLSRFTFPRESFLCPALFSVPVRVFSVPAVFAIRKSSRMAFRAAPVSLVCVCVCVRARVSSTTIRTRQTMTMKYDYDFDACYCYYCYYSSSYYYYYYYYYIPLRTDR